MEMPSPESSGDDMLVSVSPTVKSVCQDITRFVSGQGPLQAPVLTEESGEETSDKASPSNMLIAMQQQQDRARVRGL